MGVIPYEEKLRDELVNAIHRLRMNRKRAVINRVAIVGAASVFLAGVGIAAIVSVVGESGPRSISRNAPMTDIQNEGPLGGGVKVTLDEAKREFPDGLAIPPTNEITGELSGIWMTSRGCEGSECSGPQVGFVWATDMRFYVSVPNITEDVASQEWKRKAAKERGSILLRVHGHTAIGQEGAKNGTSGLTWMAQGLALQFVSPSHGLEELKSLAEAITYQ
jgi:hypothetical protein